MFDRHAMNGSARIARRLLAAGALAFCSNVAPAEPPKGFEVVYFAAADRLPGWPNINDCGQVVFWQGYISASDAEIYLYDNGVVYNITDDDVADAWPDINDHGVIAWTRNVELSARGEVYTYDHGKRQHLGSGITPYINRSGHVAWFWRYGVDCTALDKVMYYDGTQVIPLTEGDDRSNQTIRINDRNEVTWNRYDFCHSPWTSEVFLWGAGGLMRLWGDTQVIATDLNNSREVVWLEDPPYVLVLWKDGERHIITEPLWGTQPAINDRGDIMMTHQPDDHSSEVWLYRKEPSGPIFYRITDNTHYDHIGELNNWGEAAWNWVYDPDAEWTGGVGMMRRIRTGEADFDGDIDLTDYAKLSACLDGPGFLDRNRTDPTDTLCDCRFLDLDHDNDVDLRDVSRFQNAFGLTP